MKQVDEATGGGISGFLEGLAGGGAQGGGDAKNVGRFIQSLNPFGGASGGSSGGASGGGSDGTQSRGELVKRVMKEHPSWSLGEASKYVKSPFKIPDTFETPSQETVDFVEQVFFNDIFGDDEIKEHVKKLLARGLAGHVEDKEGQLEQLVASRKSFDLCFHTSVPITESSTRKKKQTPSRSKWKPKQTEKKRLVKVSIKFTRILWPSIFTI